MVLSPCIATLLMGVLRNESFLEFMTLHCNKIRRPHEFVLGWDGEGVPFFFQHYPVLSATKMIPGTGELVAGGLVWCAAHRCPNTPHCCATRRNAWQPDVRKKGGKKSGMCMCPSHFFWRQSTNLLVYLFGISVHVFGVSAGITQEEVTLELIFIINFSLIAPPLLPRYLAE